MRSIRASAVAKERERILTEIGRRAREIPRDRDAQWQPAMQFLINERRRVAAALLKAAGVFPQRNTRCLEIGFGSGGWLPDLIAWGVMESNLYGIEISEAAVEATAALLPAAHLKRGDAAEIPWQEESFDLVIASTVFTSILDQNVRRIVAEEITRVLVPGGALLWYDFKFNNPQNHHVRKVDRRELLSLFPRLRGRIRSVTLAPPLLRAIVPASWTLATLLNSMPFLRTHLIGVLVKDTAEMYSTRREENK